MPGSARAWLQGDLVGTQLQLPSRSYAGGIRLDTLFIDEGFGSLDPESLELAIRALIDLQQAGRMVGVISHVSEMKEQMELRVDIEKGLKGRHLRVRSPGIAESAA